MANYVLWQALNMQYPSRVDVLHPATDASQFDNHFYYIPYLNKWQKFTHLLQGRIHRYTPWVLDFVDQHPNEYSHCIINCGLFGDLVEGLKKRGLKVCTIHHNYEVKYQMDNKRPSSFGGLTDIFVKRNEKIAYQHSDMNLFLTQYDAEQLGIAYGPSVGCNHVIGLFGRPNMNEKPISIDPLVPNRLVISGGLDSVQSVEGIKQFFREVIPAVDKFYQGDYSLLLAGRCPREEVMEYQKKYPQVTVVANPIDMFDTIRSQSIYICPVNKGSGMKIRLLDGLKIGMPIITHRVSAQGYDMLWDKPWFQIYDDEPSFMVALEKISSIIKSKPNLRQEIIETYLENFSFEKGSSRYVSAIQDFVK